MSCENAGPQHMPTDSQQLMWVVGLVVVDYTDLLRKIFHITISKKTTTKKRKTAPYCTCKQQNPMMTWMPNQGMSLFKFSDQLHVCEVTVVNHLNIHFRNS